MTTPGFHEVQRSRRSVRRFSARPVEAAKLETVMEAGRCAASAANRQPWRFLLLAGAGKAAFDPFLKECFREAPVAIVAFANPGEAWVRRGDGRNFAWVDVAIAVAEMALAATAEGLGSCWVAAFDAAEAKRALGVGDPWETVTALVVGYAADEPPPAGRQRKSRADVWDERS